MAEGRKTVRTTTVPEALRTGAPPPAGERPSKPPRLSLEDVTILLKMLRTSTVEAVDIEHAYKTVLKMQDLFTHLKRVREERLKEE